MMFIFNAKVPQKFGENPVVPFTCFVWFYLLTLLKQVQPRKEHQNESAVHCCSVLRNRILLSLSLSLSLSILIWCVKIFFNNFKMSSFHEIFCFFLTDGIFPMHKLDTWNFERFFPKNCMLTTMCRALHFEYFLHGIKAGTALGTYWRTTYISVFSPQLNSLKTMCMLHAWNGLLVVQWILWCGIVQWEGICLRNAFQNLSLLIELWVFNDSVDSQSSLLRYLKFSGNTDTFTSSVQPKMATATISAQWW